jgi:hypothetical protein
VPMKLGGQERQMLACAHAWLFSQSARRDVQTNAYPGPASLNGLQLANPFERPPAADQLHHDTLRDCRALARQTGLCKGRGRLGWRDRSSEAGLGAVC